MRANVQRIRRSAVTVTAGFHAEGERSVHQHRQSGADLQNIAHDAALVISLACSTAFRSSPSGTR
jgi:hypothetical protein